MFKRSIFIAATTVLLTACASSPDRGKARINAKDAQTMSLPPAPMMDSVGDAPVVTASPVLKRTNPIEVVKSMTRGDDIVVKPPVPVLSATITEAEKPE